MNIYKKNYTIDIFFKKIIEEDKNLLIEWYYIDYFIVSKKNIDYFINVRRIIFEFNSLRLGN
jgi:hypothetical protein